MLMNAHPWIITWLVLLLLQGGASLASGQSRQPTRAPSAKAQPQKRPTHGQLTKRRPTVRPGTRASDTSKKLHKLRHCQTLIQYHTEELITHQGWPVTVLVSDYVEGEILTTFLRHFPGRRLQPFEALHLLYALVKGMEDIHLYNEYHGDLHTDNIFIESYGLDFELKLIDLYHWEGSKIENRQADICDVIKVFYDVLGGARTYSRQPDAVKYICCGLKRSIILRKFRTMSHLRRHLETMEW